MSDEQITEQTTQVVAAVAVRKTFDPSLLL